MESFKWALLCCALFFIKIGEAATFTTTAVAGTWDIGGQPTSSDNIVVNHNWSGYDGGTLANYSGTMTINNGGWYRINGTFSNFTGNINIAAGVTFYLTGSVSTASEAFGGSITVNGTWRTEGSFANGFCTIAGTGYIRADGGYSGGCNGSVTLPVELLSFDAEKIDNEVHLNWATASEINSDFYTVKRSYNGIDFITIGTVTAAGNSNSMLHYNFIDGSPNKGLNYYQLTEYDFDGKEQNSPIVSVNLFGGESIFAQLYPNPTSEEVSLYFNSQIGGVYQLVLTDVMGSTMYTAHIAAMVGENKFNISLLPYPDAPYFVKLVSPNGETTSLPIIKK